MVTRPWGQESSATSSALEKPLAPTSLARKKHLSAGKQAPDYSEVVRKALCSATFQRREQKSTQKGRELLYATCLRVAFKRCIFGAAAFAKAMSSFCLSAPLGHPPRLLRGKGACERRLRHKQAKVHRSSLGRRSGKKNWRRDKWQL